MNKQSTQKRIATKRENTALKYATLLIEIFNETNRSLNKQGFIIKSCSQWANDRNASVTFLQFARDLNFISIISCDETGRILLNKKRGPYLIRWKRKTSPTINDAHLIAQKQTEHVALSKARPENEKLRHRRTILKDAKESTPYERAANDSDAIPDDFVDQSIVDASGYEKTQEIAPECVKIDLVTYQSFQLQVTAVLGELTTKIIDLEKKIDSLLSQLS